MPKLQEEFEYKNPMQVPRLEKIVINMAVGKAVADSKKLTNAHGRADQAQRPEAGRVPGAQVGRELQAARGHADRLQGHLAPAAHVRVPRPAGEHRPAARARLPRRVAEELRRARQLRARASRSRSSSPRSASTTSRRRGAWTSSSARRRGPTRRPRRFSPASTCRSGSDGARLGHGEEERRREEQPPSQDGGPVRRQACRR